MTEEQIKQKAKRFCNRYNFSYTILSYNQTKRKSGVLIAEESYIAGYHECEKDTIHTDNKETLNNALKRIEELEAQIEKLIDFVISKTECCDVCPITDTCINSEGTCPYAGILAKGEEEVTREWLMQFILRR